MTDAPNALEKWLGEHPQYVEGYKAGMVAERERIMQILQGVLADQDAWFAHFSRKYVQRADERQRQMGLIYTEAETHDLAKEAATYALASLAAIEADPT
jgi:hypothetical protein